MRRRILILGLPYFGTMMARVLGDRGWRAEYRHHPGRDLRAWAALLPALARADLVYFISARVDRCSPQALLSLLWPRPIVIHWVGADVGFALAACRAGKASKRLLRRATHLADAPWLIDELQETGAHAEYLPMPVGGISTAEPPPLPETFRVLVYYPLDPVDRESFDTNLIFRVIDDLPSIPFLLIPTPPDALPGSAPPNLEARGWVDDMDAVYRDSTVYLRGTIHDGTSFMAIEALSRGRHVIWSFPIEGAILARSYDEVTAALKDLAERHAAGRLALNTDGRDAVLRNFDPARLAEELDRRLHRTLRRSGR